MPQRPESGFTLIELLMVMTVVAVMAAIAVPSYGAYFERSRRAEAKSRLLEAAQWLERQRAERAGVYTGATLPVSLRTSPASGSPMYDLSVTVTDTTYLLSAVPRAGTPVAAPGGCGTLTLAHDGRRLAGGDGAAAAIERCWNR
jgi:type IV pilus assembly protein PilE